MKLRELLFLVFCIPLFGACSHGDSERILRQAEAVVQERPDSALVLLQSLDRHCLGSECEARFCLLYTMAQDKSLVEVFSDSLLRIAYDYYRRHERDTLAARAYLYMGRFYARCDSTKLAASCMQQSRQLARHRQDHYTEYLALDGLWRVVAIGDPHQALAYAQEAYWLYENQCTPNISNKVYLLLGIAHCHNLCNETDSALHYARTALLLAESLDDTAPLANVYQNFAVIYEKTEEYDSALVYSKKAWKRAPVKAISRMQNLATSYQNADSLEQAMHYYEMVAEQGNNTYCFTAYQEMAQLARLLSEPAKAMEYADSAIFYLGEMYMDAAEDNARYNQERERMLSEEFSAHERAVRSQWMIVLLGVLVILIPLTLYNVYKVHMGRQMLAREKEEAKMMRIEAEKERMGLLMENKNLQIEAMRKVLMTKMNFLQNLQQKDVRNKILIRDEDWNEIIDFLEGVGNQFVSRLAKQYPELKDSDLRLCMLVRLHLTTAQLAAVYCIAEDSIKKRLLRLKEKLRISNSSMRTFLEHF